MWLKPRLVQRTADKGHVVARPAAAARLGHDDEPACWCRIVPESTASISCPTTVMEGKQASLLTNFRPMSIAARLSLVKNLQCDSRDLLKIGSRQVKVDGGSSGARGWYSRDS